MDSIRILNEDVASKIAAGEVVERPASVVRELMDNSIDARSERIFVKIQNGGKALIRVSDDGAGMSRDDLLLSVERHATSKIKDVSDLQSVATLGFRGEALPSIASVSRMEITTRPAEELTGHRLVLAGGRMKSIDETGAPAGTAIEVRNLFYNVPARKKFLRTVRTETDHIAETFSRIALPFIGTHFKLEDGERTLLNLPASTNDLNRLSVLLGRETASSMKEVHQETDGIKIRAYLASPDLNRSRGDRVLVYVNHRNVRDRLITRAVMEGYGSRLMKGRYPQVVLFLEIDPGLLDVNVHPTKQEVRFRNASSLYQALLSVFEGALKPSHHVPAEMPYGREPGRRHAPFGGVPLAESWKTYDIPLQSAPSPATPGPLQQPLIKDVPRIIGQLKNTYILCQTDEGLVIVDQHAAHERVVYEKLGKAFRESRIEGQAFLIPHQLELSMKDASILLKGLETLRELGFEIEHFGGNTFLIRSVPALLVDLRWEAFLRDLLPILEEERPLHQDSALEKSLTTMACHGAIRAGKRLSLQEMETLLDQLEKTEIPTNCPHGRPVSRAFGYGEIEKMFKRVL